MTIPVRDAHSSCCGRPRSCRPRYELTYSGCVQRFDELLTPRLVLRRWRPADLEPFAALNADTEVMRYFLALPSRQETEQAIAGWEAKFDLQGYGLWALQRREDGMMLGMTGLNPVPPAVGVDGVEVGWRLARHAWGHGYATEAANAALEVARQAHLREIWSFTAELTYVPRL